MDNFFHSLYTELVWFLKTRARLGFNTSQQRDEIKLSGVKTVSKETKAGFYFAEVVFFCMLLSWFLTLEIWYLGL